MLGKLIQLLTVILFATTIALAEVTREISKPIIEDSVMILDDTNFDNESKKHQFILVRFFHP